ncbi:MAG: hypothetical protein HY695_12090 [Deltaproteobacteria bacterium]|nr:hypothetical protein [Deltaproteobacteria bacterium]
MAKSCTNLKKLQEAFEIAFNIPFSTLVIPAVRVQKIGSESLLFGSAEAARHPMLVQGDIMTFDETSPAGYFLVGFWGHGVNSYAFYYSFDDGRNKICLRLPYGGVYMDNKIASQRIAGFLSAFFVFLNETRIRGASVVAIESMGLGRYRVLTAGGEKHDHKGSLLGQPRFKKALGLRWGRQRQSLQNGV